MSANDTDPAIDTLTSINTSEQQEQSASAPASASASAHNDVCEEVNKADTPLTLQLATNGTSTSASASSSDETEKDDPNEARDNDTAMVGDDEATMSAESQTGGAEIKENDQLHETEQNLSRDSATESSGIFNTASAASSSSSSFISSSTADATVAQASRPITPIDRINQLFHQLEKGTNM